MVKIQCAVLFNVVLVLLFILHPGRGTRKENCFSSERLYFFSLKYMFLLLFASYMSYYVYMHHAIIRRAIKSKLHTGFRLEVFIT